MYLMLVFLSCVCHLVRSKTVLLPWLDNKVSSILYFKVQLKMLDISLFAYAPALYIAL